ncbi:MAG TPA: DUF2071 domain-containing protein [Thermoanaerobaculia bacterium]
MHIHDQIDRLTPTQEPDQPVVMHQNWHHLGFFHWEVPVADLQQLLPPGLTVDTFEGKAYVGLVPFTITGVRAVLTPPLPWISSFHEINVRTYVHHQGHWPGVWFFSLDASSTLAVTAARAMYKLNYLGSEIQFEASKEPSPTIRFTSHRQDERGPTPANAHLRYRPVEGPTFEAVVGTLDHFLCERYILYAADADKNLYRARVHHQSYPLQRAEVLELDETLTWSAGVRRGEQAPIRHYASEVNVKVYPLEKVPRGE